VSPSSALCQTQSIASSPPAAANLSVPRSALCWTLTSYISHLIQQTDRPTRRTHSKHRRLRTVVCVHNRPSAILIPAAAPRFDVVEAKRYLRSRPKTIELCSATNARQLSRLLHWAEVAYKLSEGFSVLYPTSYDDASSSPRGDARVTRLISQGCRPSCSRNDASSFAGTAEGPPLAVRFPDWGLGTSGDSGMLR
jgi:antitoxin (DNA-binding transcriptional repressor) of toxin-antitoxin stability system